MRQLGIILNSRGSKHIPLHGVAGFYPDQDPTFEKKSGSGSDLPEKSGSDIREKTDRDPAFEKKPDLQIIANHFGQEILQENFNLR